VTNATKQERESQQTAGMLSEEAPASNDASEGTEEHAQGVDKDTGETPRVKEDVEELRDRLLRVSAEFENYKKRNERQMEEFRRFANEEIIQQILPIVDNLERAIDHAECSDQAAASLVEGVRMTQREILKVLEKFQVAPIEALGKPFDPNYHQALMQEESHEHAENTVVREMQKGYTMHNRLLRPSLVVVSKGRREFGEGEKPSSENQ